MASNRPNVEEPTLHTQTQTQAQGRRKGIEARVWLVVSPTGLHHEEVGKHSIMSRTGLPARDLRVLDPMLSYPSTILGRERAIVVNLEHIKAIITSKEVLMINSSNPLVVEFVEDVQHRVSCSNGKPQKATENIDIDDQIEAASSSYTVPYHGSALKLSNNSIFQRSIGSESSGSKTKLNGQLGSSPKLLPFEFRALEACLESACRCLDSETTTLEQEAYPALDELTSHISTLNLERVRQIKSRLVSISGRVQKVRDELEHLLDDDNDMAEMYLTEKYSCQSADESPSGDEPNNDASELVDKRAEESKSERSSDVFGISKLNIEELEMLLEAYFVQIDGILQKLSTMSEYVDDTEDYINIMLDDKQNQLLQMGVMLNTAVMIINAGIVVAGIFGMNIHISLFDGQPKQFWETALGTVFGCLILYLFAFGWGRKKYLFAL
ncbi:hypothetical protein Ancab_024385 [Ancistrocladus abbreviatus]